MDVLAQARPTSSARPDELEYSFQHLVRHNTATPPYDDFYCAQLASAHPLDPAGELPDDYPTPNYGPGLSDEVGLGINLEGYGDSSSAYYTATYRHTGSPYTHASPLTPQSTSDDVGVRTRSGRRVGHGTATSRSRASSNSRRSKSPMPPKKNTKSAKSEKLKLPKLTEPISALTKNMDVPVKDMKAWVNRSVEVRLKEVEDRKGYITRPMNSFMLYRSAYAERLKQWGVHNNHQVVSSMAGESWPLEPPEIRDHYNELAKIERTNHQSAHPNYKFSPSKSVSPKKRKGGNYDSEEEDELTDSDDPDAEWGTSQRPPRSKRPRTIEDPHTNVQSAFGRNALSIHRPIWAADRSAKPLPQAIEHAYADHHAYQQAVYPHSAMLGLEEAQMRQLDVPRVAYPVRVARPLVGLPGGQHHDLLQVSSESATPASSQDLQMDPSLFAYHNNLFDELEASYTPAELGYAVPSDFLGTGHADWQLDPSLQSLEHGSEFDKWMDGETQ